MIHFSPRFFNFHRLFTIFLLLLSPGVVFADKSTLTVYTYDSFTSDWGPGPKVKELFEQHCHCELNLVGLEDGVSVLNRLKLEGEHSKADVVLGLDTNLTAEARRTGLFTTHQLQLNGLTLPDSWSDEIFIPYDYGYFAFIYDQTRLEQIPLSLEQLVDDPNGPTLLIQDPRTSTPGLGLLLWMKKVYGDKANDAWKRLSKRIVTVSKGWSEAYGLFLKGEADMVLSYTTSPAYHVIAEEAEQYKAAKFSEGHYQQIEVGAVLKSSSNQKLAREFLNFMLGESVQSVIPTTNWMYPASLESEKLPQAFQELVDPRPVLLFDDQQLASHRQAWIKEWLNALAQ